MALRLFFIESPCNLYLKGAVFLLMRNLGLLYFSLGGELSGGRGFLSHYVVVASVTL